MAFSDGPWHTGEFIYGFPLPFIWRGLPSMSRQIVVKNLILDFLLAYLLVSSALFLIRRFLPGSPSDKLKRGFKTVRRTLTLGALGILLAFFLFQHPLNRYVWSHDLFGDRIVSTTLHWGFYP